MKVLVLCTGNSCRSQMAEGWLRHYLGESDDIKSAGLVPHGVHPIAIEVMGEVEIDISKQTSDHVEKYIAQSFDYVITVCDNAASNCPVFPGPAERLHWPFDDPALATGTDEEIKDSFRRVRDLIGERVADWVEELG